MFHFSIYFAFLIAVFLIKEPINCLQRKSKFRYGRGTVISVFLCNEKGAAFLRELQRQNIISMWNEVVGFKQNVLLQVDGRHLEKLKEQLRIRGMNPVDTTFGNLDRDVPSQEKEEVFETHNKPNPKQYDFRKYHTLEGIVAFLKYITNKHKDISRLKIIGKSAENRPLYAVEISSDPFWKVNDVSKEIKEGRKKTKRGKRKGSLLKRDNDSRQMILMDCGMHAREWAAIAFCTYFINKLITGYKNNKCKKPIVEKYDFTIIPVINPDGYVYTHKHDRTWRKNRSKYKENPGCIGVDINRNFNFNGETEDNGPCSENYFGPRPLSEPEASSLHRLLRKTSGRVKAYFSIHAFGQLWLMPWAKKKIPPQDYDEMKRIGEIGVEAIAKKFGTKYKLGGASSLTYLARGTVLDYVYDNAFARYSFTLELRDTGNYSFMLPANQLLPLCQETTAGVLAAIRALK